MEKKINSQFILFLLLLGSGVFAQDPSSPGGGTDPGLAAAPINSYIIPMLFLVFIFGYKMLVEKEKV